VREFAVTLDADVDAVIEHCAAQGVNPGHPLRHDYPEHERGLLVAITEQRSREDIDRLAAVLREALSEAVTSAKREAK
jgi:glycine dehydrogenase subunit 1